MLSKKTLSFFLICFFLKAEQPELIESISVSRNNITIIPTKDFKSRHAVVDFFVEYEDDTLDLTQLPYSVVTIPFILHALPMIWRSGQTYYVDSMDADLYNCLEKIRSILFTFYPTLSWHGTLIARNLEQNSYTTSCEYIHNKNTVALSFSGGLDSIYNSLACIEKKQHLVTIWGADVPLSSPEMWQDVKQSCKKFSDTWSLKFSYIKSNFADLYIPNHKFNPPSLWIYATQSLGYASLLAPLAIAKGYPFIVLGSSATSEFPWPYGGHPLIEHNLTFAGINIIHLGGEYTRSEKLACIIDTCKKYNRPKSMLRVCCKKSLLGKNCGQCTFKCLPTIHELLVEGEDPLEYGFDTPFDQIIELTTNFLNGKTLLYFSQPWRWGCIQKRINQLKNRSMNYSTTIKNHLAWLASIPLEDFIAPQEAQLHPADIKNKLKSIWEKSIENANRMFNNYFQANTAS